MKKLLTGIIFFMLIISLPVMVMADSDYLKQFKKDYNLLNLDLLRHPVEEFTVTNFTYQKDVAEFTFTEGKLYFLRYLYERPTTAIFIGTGHAKITPPNPVEGRSLKSISRKDVVDEEFKIIFIRMADDFDLAVRAMNFPVVTKELKWKEFAQVKEVSSEEYFKPVIQHTYDNYFQLLRSIYERTADGYFWADFNRYNYTFDPNRPEEVIIGYEYEAGDFAITDAAVFQRQSENKNSNNSMSEINYSLTPLAVEGDFEMGGMDGNRLEEGTALQSVVVDSDSLKFVSTFLHDNLKIDSLYFNNAKVDYHRRRDFRFIGIILPEYHYQGDTLQFKYFYHGKEFGYGLPFTENPLPIKHVLNFKVPKGYNYFMPDMSEVKTEGKYTIFSAVPQNLYRQFYFQAIASGFDTVEVVTPTGISLGFLKQKSKYSGSGCYVPDDIYNPAVENSFSFMSSRAGTPAGTYYLYVYPKGNVNMPGLVSVPQYDCYLSEHGDYQGGYDLVSGNSMAHLWFGHLMKPLSEREHWLQYAASEFLSLLSVQNKSNNAYYSNLMTRRDSIFYLNENNYDRPIATGQRVHDMILKNKGTWLFHMLRIMMIDFTSMSEAKFNKFFYELTYTVNNKTYSNADIVAMVEKYTGVDMNWFFNQWLFDYGYPEFKVDYSFASEGAEHFVEVNVITESDIANFMMPVVMRIKDKAGKSYFFQEKLENGVKKFRLGPFENEPDEFVFNELFSILGKEDVNKK